MANYYRTSLGERISKAQIDRNIRRAKEEVVQDQLNEYGFNFCVECFENGFPRDADPMELKILDCSHDIPVDVCQKTGQSELAWDKTKIKITCRHHHRIKDRTNLSFKKQTTC